LSQAGLALRFGRCYAALCRHIISIGTQVEPQLLTVAEGVHAWIGAGGDSNAGAIETREGLLAIDAQQYPRLARQFRAAVEAKTGKPIRALINTHCHLDHTARQRRLR